MATPPPPVPTVPTSNTIPASSFYWIKPLGQDNWLAWKSRIQAVLQECKLIGHIDGTISEPPRTDAGYQVWKEDDEKTQTQLELSMEDKELDNLTGDNATEMWANLCNVKESKGKMGILRTRKTVMEYHRSAPISYFNLPLFLYYFPPSSEFQCFAYISGLTCPKAVIL